MFSDCGRSFFSHSINTSFPALPIHFCLTLQLLMRFTLHLQVINRPSRDLPLKSQAAFLAWQFAGAQMGRVVVGSVHDLPINEEDGTINSTS